MKFEFLRQISQEPSNTVFSLVRRKTETLAIVAKELPDRRNIHIVEGDLTDFRSLQVRISRGVFDLFTKKWY